MTHPNRAFAWSDEAAMRAFVSETAFAQIVVVADGRLASAQAPLTFGAGGSARFHLSRSNTLTAALDGAPVLASVIGTHFYVSPDWYGTADQVPTWNYRLDAEAAGAIAALRALGQNRAADAMAAVR
ncbi:FMN-binding negative transcriptional regulator [Sphingomonas crusticola]|uniref:FMN-binding negative transcriptional regulator n=1 Tax=Sphingomonas crusticola TaxID=1697973 RepID=UPI0013C2BD97|nr:FMN-binding negative transcriptional regulator [Sphingomonas crusticola]